MKPTYLRTSNPPPREDYSPRRLIDVSSPGERLYGKGVPRTANDNTTDESLPRGWSILEPNRIKERRLAAGYKTTEALSFKIRTMSYQRLHKIESGIVVVRDSEYDLIAAALDLPVHLLQLPMLMHSETVRWMELWGLDKRIEEGGDHDAVLLAAYVRYHAKLKGMKKAHICERAGVSPNAMHYIWHAAKPIDRYPDSTMKATMLLTRNTSWDNVITDSQAYYAAGFLQEQIKEVQQPRVRYAPEDPDKRAPWTYDVDPFRAHQPREAYINAYTREPSRATPTRLNILRDKRSRIHRLIGIYRDAKLLHSIATKTQSPASMLCDYYPKDQRFIWELDESAARIVLQRLLCVRYAQENDDVTATPFAHMLDITSKRFRQLKNDERKHGMQALVPCKNAKTSFNEPDWPDYRQIKLRKAA